MGTAYTPGVEDSEAAGIIPRAVQDIFEGVSNQTDNEYLVKVSFIEVRNIVLIAANFIVFIPGCEYIYRVSQLRDT